MCSVETRQRLHCFDAGQNLVHVHRVQQRLVVAGLELVGADQETVRLFLNPVGDQVRREAVEGCLCDLRTAVLVLSGEGGDGKIGTLALRQVVPDGVEVADGPLNAVGDHHGPRLPANLLQAGHLFVEVIHHKLGLEADGVVVVLHVAAQLLPARLVSNSGSPSTVLISR